MSKVSIPLHIFLSTALWLSASPILAQVTTDGTVNTQVNLNGNVAEITGGETRGDNLFHSFQDFSVQTGNEAFFNNADSISNIFSRVTGGNISNIDGLIRANGSASLFLINPNGIVFGENARLDIGGSFFGSSASSILFEDGEFSATDLDNPPLLTVNAPIGLNFRDQPGDITVRGNGNGARLPDSEVIDTQDALRVNENTTIGFLGGNVLFEDATVRTAGGRIEIGSVAEGIVDLIAVDNGFTVDYSGIETFQDISVSGRSSIDASGLGGGDIQAAGNNISLTGVSGFTSFTLGSTPGSDINIFAAESLEISGVENELNFVSGIFTRIFPNGTADAGDINIETGSLSIGDRGIISADVTGQGNGGDININASDFIGLTNQGNGSAIFSGVDAGAVGNGGDVNLATNSLTLSDGALISTASFGQGNAGNIAIDSNSLSVTSGSFFNANTRGQGNAGNISIDAADITINGQDNSEVSTGIFSNASSEATGNGGNINITTESFNLSDRASIDTSSSAQGDAGNIEIDATNSLSLNNEVSLFASHAANGQAGDVTINAREDVSFSNNSRIFVTGSPGGFINLNAKNLSITSGSNLFAGTSGETNTLEAPARNITIDLEEDLVLDGLDSDNLTFISNSSFGTGDPGNIDISARNITFQNGGSLTAFSGQQEIVQIGNVTLNATGDITFDGTNGSSRSGIINNIPENSSGSIGDVSVTAQNLTLTNGAQIASQVIGNGDSGNINLNIANSIKLDGSDEIVINNTSAVFPSQISSDITFTGTGDAGTINIKTQNLELSRNGFIRAALFGNGNGGDININAEQISIGEQGNFDALPSLVSVESFADVEGNGGNININTGSLSLDNGGTIDADLNGGTGNGGNININAGDISVEGSGIVNNTELSSAISADAFNSQGDAGDIEINTANLSVANGAFISANILGDGSVANAGNGGSIAINASDSIDVSAQGTITVDITGENSTGTGGNLTLQTPRLTIDDGAVISALAFGGENANSGDVVISTSDLTIADGAQISATVFGDGNAGSLTITASESIELTGSTEFNTSGIFASALEGSGNGGDLIISTGDLTISDGAIITASNFSSRSEEDGDAAIPGTGLPGAIEITADSINLFNRGRIETATQSAAGAGANISLQVSEDITLQDESIISARAFGQGNGGNLTIDSRFIIAFPDGNNDIIADAEQGQGGNITINAESLFGIQERTPNNLTNDINASSQVSGLDGTVDITNPDINPVQGATELPTNIVVPEETTQQACNSNREAAAGNELNIVGKGGVPPAPELPLNSLNPVGVETNSTSDIPAPIETGIGKIQLARGIEISETGEVRLVAYRTDSAGDRLPEIKPNCDRL